MDTQTTAPRSPADRAQTVGHETKQAAQGVAATAGDEARRTTREAKAQARQLWTQARSDLTDQASTQQSRAATGLRELAEQLGSMARGTDQDGMARGLVEDVARRAGNAASWLDDRDPGSLLEEARGFARRRPGTFLAVAAGLGVVAGRLSRSLVDEAHDTSGSASGDGSRPGSDSPASTAGTGNGSLAATGNADAGGVPSATSPTTSTTESTPVTSGASASVASEGMAAEPSTGLPGAHRTSQPIAPDGTPSPIDTEGNLTARGDEHISRSER